MYSDRHIYAFQNGGYDHSRWLEIAAGPEGFVEVDVRELCQPGRASCLGPVLLPIAFLHGVLNNGGLQLSLPGGYLAMRCVDSLLSLEFRSAEDLTFSKSTVLADDVLRQLAQCEAGEPAGCR